MQSKQNPNTNQLPGFQADARQIDLILAELSRIKPDITTLDRRAAIKELNYSEFTVVQYLGGNGTNLDTAAALLRFFKAKIAERTELISQS